jgi:cytoskeletal protein RodZ
MAEIGTTLRETRIRDKIDITTVEEATKIRAKYLRALENEEWGVLPGPAYIKSFLRTYAEFLGIDAHMLVEEYRARFERPEQLEVPAFTRNAPLRGRVRPPGPPSRAWVVAALAVGLLVVLFVLGITSDENGKDSGSTASDRSKSRNTRTGETSPRRRNGGAAPARAEPKVENVQVSVVPSRASWVCLVDAAGRLRIEGRTVAVGQHEGPFTSKRFKITVGNGGGDFRVNGKLRDVPDRSKPLGYSISSNGVRLLSESEQPTCEPGGPGSTGTSTQPAGGTR